MCGGKHFHVLIGVIWETIIWNIQMWMTAWGDLSQTLEYLNVIEKLFCTSDNEHYRYHELLLLYP